MNFMRKRFWPGVCWGSVLCVSLSGGCSSDDGAAPMLISMEPAAQLSAGSMHTCAALRNGNGACWGRADHGELGKTLPENEGSTPSPQPLSILPKIVAVGAGTYGSCAVLEDKTVSCWGDNRSDQLGLGLACSAGDSQCVFEPKPVPGLSDIVAVVANKPAYAYASADMVLEHVACALDASGLVRCWGAPTASALGRGSSLVAATTPDVVVDFQGFMLRDVVQISAGGQRVCALDVAGSVWCWGLADSFGQPGGAGATRIELPLPAKAVSAGVGHACAVLKDGHVACWGRNINGECGVSSTGNETCCSGSDGGCFADCRPKPVLVQNVVGAVGVAAGGYHSCAWLANGKGVCWGSNQALQLGNENRTLEAAPVALSAISDSIAEIVAGSEHSCLSTVEGAVFCWGGTSYGQAGL